LAAASDDNTRARRAQRIAELELRDSGPHAVPAQPPATDIRARVDHRQVTFDWQLPAGTRAPALQILVLRREETGISAERRTVRLPDAQGTLSPAHRPHPLAARRRRPTRGRTLRPAGQARPERTD